MPSSDKIKELRKKYKQLVYYYNDIELVFREGLNLWTNEYPPRKAVANYKKDKKKVLHTARKLNRLKKEIKEEERKFSREFEEELRQKQAN